MKVVFDENFRLMGTHYYQENAEKIVSKIGKISSKWNKDNSEVAEYVKKNWKDLYKYYRITTTDVQLFREPANEYDKNAIKVTIEGFLVGYLPADIASQVNKYLLNPNRYKLDLKLTGRGGSFKTLSKNLDRIIENKKEISFDLSLKITDTKTSFFANLLR